MPDNTVRGVLPGVIRQQGYVVNDLDMEIERWWNTLGVGPWFTMRGLVVPEVDYRGEPTTLEMSIALANSGNMQIELIEQHSAGRSCYREFLDSGRVGFHHMSWWMEDYDQVRERASEAGWGVLQAGDINGIKFCYFDTEHSAGVVTEIMELNDITSMLMDYIRAAAAEWDGITDPVRNLG